MCFNHHSKRDRRPRLRFGRGSLASSQLFDRLEIETFIREDCRVLVIDLGEVGNRVRGKRKQALIEPIESIDYV